MKYINQSKLAILFAFFGVFAFHSCVDDEFDRPPVEIIQELEPNATIADIKALGNNNNLVEIVDDLIVKATVISSDEQGNWFREMIVQDETGGMQLNIDLVEAHNFYPAGREVFIKCQGLFIAQDGELIELGGFKELENGIEGLGDILDVEDHLIKGSREQFVTPKVITIDEFNMNDVNTLIQLENVEFVNLGETYADAIGRNSQNKDVTDCNGDETIIRTSGFATFAAVEVAEGNGTLTAVLSAFGSTYQLLIRDLDDVQMNDPRCTGGTGSTGNEQLRTIEEVRSLINIGSAPSETKVRGIVISDADNGNITGRNLYLQDATAGIVIRFDGNHDFALNDEIEVVISNEEISEFNGLMQVNNVPNGNATKVADGTSPTPRTATISQILNNAEAWESTLVSIENVSISGNNVFDFLTDLSDGTGSITMFTASGSSFANVAVPSGTVTLTGIVSQFNDPQILIRNLDDVDADGGMTGGNDPQPISIQEIREIGNTGGNSVPADSKIKGIVISDVSAENTSTRNMVVQDGDFGIVVRFTDAHSFPLGTEIEIVVSNDEISEFNGLMQINNVANSDATDLGMGNMPDPRETSIEALLNNAETWESTLVLLEDVTLSGASTFSGALTVSDGSDEIDLFTRSQASFSGAAIPSGEVSLTAIVSEFNEYQIIIRNLDDVE